MENKLNTGAIFKNTYKTSEKHPDYKGKGNVNGKEMEIAAWIKQGANGSFMSLSFKEPYVAPQVTPIETDNDLPF